MKKVGIDNENYIEYQDTPWDSLVLKVRANEITAIKYSIYETLLELFARFETLCINEKIGFTNLRIHPDNLDLRKCITDLNYSNVETSLLVELINTNFRYDPNLEKLLFTLREFNINDTEDIKYIAGNFFNHGRFFEDPKIPRKIARIRNENWIDDLAKNSKILIGEKANKIFAFMAISVRQNKSQLLLGGVNPDYSIFAFPFWYKVLNNVFKDYKSNTVSAVVSASNLRVLNLYSFFGFKFTETFLGYHKFRSQ